MNLSFIGSVFKKFVYFVDYFLLQNLDVQKLFEELMDIFEEEFDMKRVVLNFMEFLNEKVMNLLIRNIMLFQFGSNCLVEYVLYQKVGKLLVEVWEDMFFGVGYLFFDLNLCGVFQWSVNLMEDDYNVVVERQQEFQEFFIFYVFCLDVDICLDGIMILDMGIGGILLYC